MSDKYKLHPRNATAWNADLIAGNCVTSRLESSVGNCFPGLESDVRNLERRFFPHLAVDFSSRVVGGQFIEVIQIGEVQVDAARAANLDPADLTIYEQIALEPEAWLIISIKGNFGPFGDLDLMVAEIGGSENEPADPWTAVRLLPESRDVTIRLRRSGGTNILTLVAPRVRYFEETGAINPAFHVGELTQSLCSPWTHDFRDCGCFYWASNHPDIAQPHKPSGLPPSVALDSPTQWQRSVKGTLLNPPAPAVANSTGDEMLHYEINHRWEELGIVLDGREQLNIYSPPMFSAVPFATVEEMLAHVRYAAGVELAVTLEYLSAAYSLNLSATGGTLAGDIRASFAEILRIAIGEMKHIRLVNDMLKAFFQDNLVPTFAPVLQVAAEVPTGGGNVRPFQFRSLTMNTLESFIDVERPSFSVDGLYGRILATVQQRAPGPLEAVVTSIMADGTDHFDTFSYIKEWLGRHSESSYLLNLTEPDNSNPQHTALQTNYRQVLESLHSGYEAGFPDGGAAIASARTQMVARPGGLHQACEQLANAGVRVTFETPNDPRFTPINRPAP